MSHTKGSISTVCLIRLLYIENTVFALLDASTNPDITRLLNTESFKVSWKWITISSYVWHLPGQHLIEPREWATVKCVRSGQPFSPTHISKEEIISLERAVAVAGGGLYGPIHELAKYESGSFNMDRVRAPRVATALVQRRMEDEAGCLDVLQTG